MPPKPQPTATAQEQVKNLYESVLDGNEERFAGGFAISNQSDAELVEEYFKALRSFAQLRNSVLAAYGPDSWAKLQERTNGVAPESDVKVTLPSITREDCARPSLLSKGEGDNSYRYTGFGPEPLLLRRTDGGWLAQPSFEGTNMSSLPGSLRAMRGVVEGYISRLRNKPESFDRFHTDLATDLVAAMFTRH